MLNPHRHENALYSDAGSGDQCWESLICGCIRAEEVYDYQASRDLEGKENDEYRLYSENCNQVSCQNTGGYITEVHGHHIDLEVAREIFGLEDYHIVVETDSYPDNGEADQVHQDCSLLQEIADSRLNKRHLGKG